MPKVNIQGVGAVNFPDSMSSEDIQAAIERDILPKQQKPDLKVTNPTEYDPASPEYQAKYGPQNVPFAENMDAGAGKAMVDLARGAGQYLGLVNRDDVAASRAQDAPLMSTGAGKLGAVTGGVATALPAMAIPGVNTVAGAASVGGVYGALQPSVSTEETLRNSALGMAAGAAGQVVGQKVADFAGRKMAEWTARKAAERSANAVRDTTLASSQQAGYVVPPSTTNPTVLNRALESVSGKAATQQAAAFKNQRVTDAIVRRELGLAADAPITQETLGQIRQQAGQVYEAVKSVGPIIDDAQYGREIAALSSRASKVQSSFPGMNIAGAKEIQELQAALTPTHGQPFDADATLELLKTLREDAADNLAFGVQDTGKKALGRVQRRAAEALEGLIERNLKQQGQGDLMTAFRDARTLIAKSYTVQKALNEGTGSVAAGKLVGELRKAGPLSGGLRDIAKFAAAFPKAAAEQTTSPGVSALDAMVGGVGGMTVNPALAGIPMGRMAAREAILSGPYQSAFTAPNYDPSATGSLLLRLLQAQPPLTEAAAIGVPANVRQ